VIKNDFLINGLFAALVLASPLAGAGEYPPAFEPEVIYRDPDLISKTGQAIPAPAPAPQAESKAQSLYPAAFEPEVLYRDAELIAKHATKPAEPAATRAVSEPAAPSATAVSTSAKTDNPLMENLPVALVVLGLAGFVVWNMKKGSAEVRAVPQQAAAAPVQAAPAGSAQETGVARYLKSLPAVAVATETGVAKYLKSLPVAAAAAVTAAAETGVAKYLKTLPAATPKATGGETGVAKYLKNLGA
jgi:hypothetical protein